MLPVGAGDCLCPKCLRREIVLRVGLCGVCGHASAHKTKAGSTVFRCGLSDRDPSYRKYPRLPKASCPGFAEAL